MAVKIYEYNGCSTCRNALKFLTANGIKHIAVPIVETPPTMAELKRMLSYVGDIKKLFNTSGLLYREMKIGDKLKNMTENEALSLLAKHGKLVKRPFVLLKDRGLVGFKEDIWKTVFKS